MGDKLDWGDETAAAGVRQRRFDVHRGGRRVPGLLWEPDGGPDGGSRPLVLAGHGAGNDKAGGYIVSLARRLVRHHSIAVAAIDGPVHGDRRVHPDDGSTLVTARFSQAWASDPALTDEMVADWRATLDALAAQPGLDGPVGYWGLSMGTIFGLPLVAAEPRVEAAVLGLMGLTGPTRERIAADAPMVGCPVLFLLQLHDELFPPDVGLALFEAIGSTDKRLHLQPGRHVEVPAEEFAASEAFLAARLLAAPSAG